MDSMMMTPPTPNRSIRVIFLTILVAGLLTYIIIQAVKPSILPNEFRLFRSPEEVSFSAPSIPQESEVTDEPDLVFDEDTDTVPTEAEGPIDFENPPKSIDSEVLAMTSRPEMDTIRESNNAIPQRLMGSVNGAVQIFRAQTSGKNETVGDEFGYNGPDVTQFNGTQGTLD
tara:strand:- start:219 stop:731 length:513 start_codon:yes stop_codon:yes gene_type:complete